MRGWVQALLMIAGVAFLAGIFVVWVARSREAAHREGCLNNFRLLGQFAATYANPPRAKSRADLDSAVPPGTVPNLTLPVDQRLSWIAGNLAALSPRDTPLAQRINASVAWDAPANLDAARTLLALVTCPGREPPRAEGTPALAQFVGIGGAGADAATLDLGPPVPNRAGCFRYGLPTPLSTILANDGLSQTAMFAEVRNDLGPWVRGGPSTVRCADVTDANWRASQFAGNFDGVSGFGLADGSARFFSMTTNPQVLLAMFTIAGRGYDPVVGE